jgi:hypothetical protein
MRCKFVVILFILILSTQKVFLTAAESDYAESIQLWLDIDPSMNCSVTAIFSFSDLSYPLNFIDFQSEPSFLGLQINAVYYTGEESTEVMIDLNGSKVSRDRGRFIADMMIIELEKDFGIPPLSYSVPTVFSPGVLTFAYARVLTNSATIELRNIFLDSLPSQGFKQILTSMLINSLYNNYDMHINLGKEGSWSLRLVLSKETGKLVPDQEQIISLKEITGYSGRIVSASTVSSTLNIGIYSQIGKDYNLIVNSVSPTQMIGGYREQNPQYEYTYDVTGSSVKDFSISLKVVSSGIVSAVLIVLAQITTLIISIIIIKRHKS